VLLLYEVEAREDHNAGVKVCFLSPPLGVVQEPACQVAAAEALLLRGVGELSEMEQNGQSVRGEARGGGRGGGGGREERGGLGQLIVPRARVRGRVYICRERRAGGVVMKRVAMLHIVHNLHFVSLTPLFIFNLSALGRTGCMHRDVKCCYIYCVWV